MKSTSESFPPAAFVLVLSLKILTADGGTLDGKSYQTT